MSRRAKKITVTTVGTPPLEGAKVVARLIVAEIKKRSDRNALGNQEHGAVPSAVKASMVAGDEKHSNQYLAEHPLTVYLKGKYPSAFHQIAAVHVRPVVDVDPSSWPMISATGLPHDVPRHLVKAHALLRWSVHEINPDPAALDSANQIIHDSWLQLLAGIGLKHVQAGQKGRAQQKRNAGALRTTILSTFDQLRSEQPTEAKIEPIVEDTAKQCGCSARTVWRALDWRQNKLTVNGAD